MHVTNVRSMRTPHSGPKIKMAALVVAACHLFDVKASALQGYDMSPKLIRIRGLIVYVARTNLRETFAVIAAHMNRDSSTVQTTFKGASGKVNNAEARQDIADLLEL